MGCNSSSAQKASTPEDGGSALPSREVSAASRKPTKAISLASRASRKSLSVLSACKRSSQSILSRFRSDIKSSASAPSSDKIRLPVLLPSVGPPLTPIESVFNQKCFKCKECGNQGLDMFGKFCKCPYGGKRPPIDLDGKVLKDCTALQSQPDGTIRKPIFKLGIRGHYVFAVNGLHQNPRTDGVPVLRSFASSASTLEEVLLAVQSEMHCCELEDLINALPSILEEALSILGMQDLGLIPDAVDAVVYHCQDADVEDKMFLNWLDTAGYEMLAIDGDLALDSAALGVSLRAGLRHDGRALRMSFYRNDVCVDALIQTSSLM